MVPPMAKREHKGDVVFGARLKRAREALGLSQAELAKTLGITQGAVQQWEGGWVMPQANRLKAIARAVGKDVEELVGAGAAASTAAPAAEPPLPPSEAIAPAPALARQDMPLSVPVFGMAIAGDHGDFSINGQIVDYVRRPPVLANARNAFAIFCASDSMYPLYEPGDPIYVNPARPPRVGDYVLIELHSTHDGEPGPAYVKKLVKRTDKEIVLAQFNPPREDIKIPYGKIKQILRIMPAKELLGV